MQAGDYDPALMPARRIFVNGVHRHHVQDSIDAPMGSDLPAQVSGVSGGNMATGSVTFAPQEDVVTQAPSPLRRANGWPPQRGDALDIYDEIPGVARWKQATGRVVDVRAGLGEGEIDVEWSDDLEASLSAPTTVPPVASGMPGEEVNVGGELRRYMARTGIEPWGIAVAALHDAGYRLLPSLPSVDFYGLFQGNLHPRIGRIAAANATGNVLEWDSESGFQYNSNWADFVPGYQYRDSSMRLGIFLRKTVGGPDAQTRWTMDDGSEIRVTLQNNSAAVSRNGVVLIQQGFTTDSPLPWVGVNIGYSRTTLWTAAGIHNADHVEMPLNGLDWSKVRCLGVAALAVAYESYADWPGFSWPSLRFRGAGPGHVRETVATRTIENQPVRDVLADICDATLSAFWLDEQGDLNIKPAVVLENQAPVETITTRDNILAGSWTETGGGVASTVVTRYQEAAVTTQPVIGVDVGGSGSHGKTLPAGSVEEEFIGPGADEEWIEPDMSPLPAGQNTPLMTNDAQFSWWGGSYVYQEFENENGNTIHDSTIYDWANLPFGEDYLRLDVSEVSPKRWRLRHSTVAGAPMVQLVTLSNSSVLPTPWTDYPLPIWRARGRVMFADASVTYARGPSWAPSYEHDIGAWGSRNDAHRIGDYLAGRMANIQIVLNDLEVIHDPRRQRGDVVDVDASGVLGGTLRCLVLKIKSASSSRGITQRLTLRVISATPEARWTYADLEASASTYTGLEASEPTYTALEAG